MRKTIRKSKKALAYALMTALTLSTATPLMGETVSAASNLNVTEAAGWLESAYVEWQPISGAKGYAAYVKGASESDASYKQLDSELIRQYGSYWRADALGLPAGNYVMKVVAVMNDGSTVGVATSALSVAAHDRSGYAWVNGTSSGAYNEDGSLKSNAKVIYVTESTKGSLVSELDSYADGNYPLAVRIVGEVTDFSGMDKGDLLIDNGGNTSGLTIEGVGEDATANGWGIRIKNSSNVEVRNIGVMNVDSSEGDNIGLQQNNDHVWVHNCDLFYGDAGSDADQVKGDGALDTKKSHYVTHSYNHFWDSGKCNLQGANKSDTSNYITYHHNWYDHSDSRHPRVRVATVHVYNNYYDGVAKYGIGSTTDSDIFAEANYFRNCRYPMMISKQGTDNLGEGTFSGEAGGMIKAYNNYIEGAESFISYQDNNSEFDAYVASSRDEKVPSSVKAASGGATYNNFDTASDMYSYNVQSPQDAKASVEKYAGRVNGGDFKWDFNDSVEDTNHAVINELKSALTSYSTSLVSVGGYEGSVNMPGDTPVATATPTQAPTTAPTQAPTTAPTQAPTAAPTQAPSGDVTAASYVHNFTEDGKNSDFYSITGNLSTSKGTVTYNGETLKQCLKMESSTKVSFTVDSDAELVLVFNSANSSNVKVDGTKKTLSDGVLTMDIKAGSHTITKADTANLFYMEVKVAGGNSGSTTTPAPTAAPTATPKPTAAPTATPKPTAAPTATPKPTAAPTTAPSGVAYTGSVTIKGANWWASKDVSKADLLGGVDASAVTAIKFSGDTEFTVGYNGTTQYTQLSGQKEYTLTDVNLGSNYYLQVCLSKNDNVDYTFEWEVYTGSSAATPAPTAAPTATPKPTVAPTATPVPTAAPTATPKPTVAPTATPVPTKAPSVEATSYVHNFTEDGKNSDFYSITGNLSTSKGTVTYNGETLKQCLKMESATKVTFTVDSDAELVLVFNSANSKNVKVDGTKKTLSDGVLTMDVKAGTHTITKADTANLFYMEVKVAGGNSGSTTTPAPTAAPTAAPTTAPTTAPTAAPTTAPTTTPAPTTPSGVKVTSVGGWNETLYVELSGISDSNVTAVSYSGPTSGSLKGDDFKYLVRDNDGGVRVDIPGLKAGTYSVTIQTSKGTVAQSGIAVEEQDRSGFAHFNYNRGVGAYNDDGTLKANAIVLYVTNDNKNTVSVTSKDGTTVSGIGHILNSAGMDVGGGATTKGGKPNNNNGIIKKLAEDGTPLVIRIIGNVTAPDGVTAYDSVNYGGSVGDNGGMARMKSGKDITIEGIGADATMNGWGIHFMAESAATDLGESFEVRNINFRNVPEDCVGMEGVQTGSDLNAPVERCWIHHCSFYAPKISNPAESDKDGGDGACDFKRGMYFTNSYCYYEGYHKTNLLGGSDSNLQYHVTYHHNYWKNCESRGPLARQADIHMYNNVFDGQSSYCMNPRANAYIFSEYNVFEDSKNPMQIKSGAIKSYNDVFTNCKGDQDGTIVSSKSTKVSSNNKYANFDTNSSVSYIPSGNYILHSTSELKSVLNEEAGAMK